MKIRIFAVLMCVILAFALAACDDNDDKEKEGGTDTAAVSDTTSGDKDIGGIILPEDGKITFGKDNKKSEDTKEAKTDNSGTDAPSKSDEAPGDDPVITSGSTDSEKSSGGETSGPSKPSDTESPDTIAESDTESTETSKESGDSGDTSSKTTGPNDNKDYGDIVWNN